MKINIAKQIDASILDKAIKDWHFTSLLIHKRPYIFMSKDTLKALNHNLLGLYLWEDIPNQKIPLNETIAMYYGNKIYLDNDLSFGEVELR